MFVADPFADHFTCIRRVGRNQGHVHGCWCVHPQEPPCRVRPRLRGVAPSFVFVPIPLGQGWCKPTQPVTRVEGAVLQSSANHGHLGHVECALHVVVEGQGLASVPKNPQGIGVQLGRIQSGRRQIVVVEAMNPFFRGGKTPPRAFGQHACLGPCATVPGGSSGRLPQNVLGRKAFFPAPVDVPTNHRKFTHEVGFAQGVLDR